MFYNRQKNTLRKEGRVGTHTNANRTEVSSQAVSIFKLWLMEQFLPYKLLRTQGRRKLSWAPFIIINTSITKMSAEKIEEKKKKRKKSSSHRI